MNIFKCISILLMVTLFSGSNVQSQIVLNHIYVVLDSSTYNRIDSSRYISEIFCSLRKSKATDQHGRSWSGLYLFGEETYLELFNGPQNTYSKIGSVAIALSVEKIGQLDSIHQKLTLQNVKHSYEMRKREINGALIPWFKQLTLLEDSVSQNPLKIWIMEYDTAITNRLPKPGETNDITRKRYNSRAYNPGRLMRSISKLTVSIDAQTYEKAINALNSVSHSTTDGSYTFSNPHFELSLHKNLRNSKEGVSLDFKISLSSRGKIPMPMFFKLLDDQTCQINLTH